MSKSRSLGPWLDEQRQRNPILAVLFFAAVLITAVITIGGAISGATRSLEQLIRWRQMEYEKLAALRAGVSVRQFEKQLGTPMFQRSVLKGKFVENVFRGRDYWVQGIADHDGTVLLYAVTACDAEFRPRFSLPDYDSSNNRITRPVTLQQTRFSDLGTSTQVRYTLPGATGNFQYREEWGGGNPTDYQVFYVGVNDACPPFLQDALDRGDIELPDLEADGGWDFYGTVGEGGEFVRDFRRANRINTYGESFLGWALSRHDEYAIREGETTLESHELPFQLGVDRIAIRHLLPTGQRPD